jgi:hypothetical protein
VSGLLHPVSLVDGKELAKTGCGPCGDRIGAAKSLRIGKSKGKFPKRPNRELNRPNRERKTPIREGPGKRPPRIDYLD